MRATVAGVNAKGACIGPMGQRVRAVMAELHGEKIDIVDYCDDPAQFVAQALSPARVSSVEVVDPEARSARVVVPDYQLSLAIGKEGQNARLAAKLTGWRIDIRPDTEPGHRQITPSAGGRTSTGRSGVSRLSEAGHAVGNPRLSTGSARQSLRTCVGCRQRADRSVLLRVVAVRGRRLSGPSSPTRGTGCPGVVRRCTPTPACLDLAERRRAFARALRRSVQLDLAPVRELRRRGSRHQPEHHDRLRTAPATRSTSTVEPESGSEADEHPMSAQR